MFLDPVIQWLSKPCPFLPPNTYSSLGEEIKRAHTKSSSYNQEPFDLTPWNDLMHHDREVTSTLYYSQLIFALESDPESTLPQLLSNWKRISPMDFTAADIRLIRGLILCPDYNDSLEDVINQLQRITGFTRIPRPMPITPILFKLAQERDPKAQLLLLKMLPQFANNYSNIPIILSTLRKLDKIPGLDLVCLELYYQMSTKEHRATSRVIEHLEYLQGKRNKSFEVCLAMATIVRRICQQRRNTQSLKEMVKFISHLINEESASQQDGQVMVVALDAIQMLCENQTINVPSTWAAIKDNFRDEQRKNVRLRLYSFFSIIPRMVRVETINDECLPDEIMAMLWRDLMTETDPELIQGIFNALKEFPYETMRFIRFPVMFREKVKLPKSHLSNVTEAEYMESFPYVPGECWVEMLDRVPKQALKFIPTFIGKFIDLELQSLRGLANEPLEGRHEPKTITGVQPKSILKALLNYLVAETRNDFEETEHVRAAIVRCLSLGFSKPLPQFDWSFLAQVYERTLELRKDCLRIICRQVENSLSARTFLERYLEDEDVRECGLPRILILMEHFHFIAKNMQINKAEILLRNCLEAHKELKAFGEMLTVLNVQELNADLRRIAEEQLMLRYSLMTEEERVSKGGDV